jgi:hypothetical protein
MIPGAILVGDKRRRCYAPSIILSRRIGYGNVEYK